MIIISILLLIVGFAMVRDEMPLMGLLVMAYALVCIIGITYNPL